MSVNVGQEKRAVLDVLRAEHGVALEGDGLHGWVEERAGEHALSTGLTVREKDPYLAYRDSWQTCEDAFRDGSGLSHVAAIDLYKEFCRFSAVPFDEKFWRQRFARTKGEDRDVTLRLLLNEWQKALDREQARWQLAEIERLRREFLKVMAKWLDVIQRLNRQLSEFGFDFGVWFDASQGRLSDQDIAELERWASYFAKDPAARQIAELLGRMRQVEKSTRLERVVKTVSIDVPVVDVNSREEIVGLRLGKDLEYALPSELALMADPETSVLFDLKFLESKLVCFDLQGVVYQGEKADIEVEAESEDEEKLGPMILCVDTSGSMNGTPENIAKAMVLYAGNKAIAQGRKCFVINFSTDIELLDLSESRSVTDLISFLKKSFHGGTDAAPALRHALKMIQEGGYEKADVLMISDFVMGELPDTLLQDIKRQRDSGNKFNSLVIGDAFMLNRLKTHFDHEWIYNYNSHTIQELVKFGQDVQRD